MAFERIWHGRGHFLLSQRSTVMGSELGAAEVPVIEVLPLLNSQPWRSRIAAVAESIVSLLRARGGTFAEAVCAAACDAVEFKKGRVAEPCEFRSLHRIIVEF